jgi:molecular chaperone DnaK (HSP70)
MAQEIAVGFDFGTSNSAIAVQEPGAEGPRLLHLDTSRPESTLVPTLLYIERDGAVHLGQGAINAFVQL